MFVSAKKWLSDWHRQHFSYQISVSNRQHKMRDESAGSMERERWREAEGYRANKGGSVKWALSRTLRSSQYGEETKPQVTKRVKSLNHRTWLIRLERVQRHFIVHEHLTATQICKADRKKSDFQIKSSEQRRKLCIRKEIAVYNTWFNRWLDTNQSTVPRNRDENHESGEWWFFGHGCR